MISKMIINPIHEIGFATKDFNITISNYYSLECVLAIEHKRKNYVFVILIKTNKNYTRIEKPNLNDDGYESFKFGFSFFRRHTDNE